MKKLLAILAVVTFIAASTAAPVIHDSAEDAYPQPIIVQQF